MVVIMKLLKGGMFIIVSQTQLVITLIILPLVTTVMVIHLGRTVLVTYLEITVKVTPLG